MTTDNAVRNCVSSDNGMKADGSLNFALLHELICHSGDPEVSGILLDECTMIIECASCREMFRNITRFVKHKLEDCQRRAEYFEMPTDSRTASQNVGHRLKNSAPPVRPERLHLREINGNTNAVYQRTSSASESSSLTTIACAMLQAASRLDNQPDVASDLDDAVWSPPSSSTFGPAAELSAAPECATLVDTCEDEKLPSYFEVNLEYNDGVGKEAEEFQVEDENSTKHNDGTTAGVQATYGHVSSTVAAAALTRSQHFRRLCDLGRLFCLPCRTYFTSAKMLHQHMVALHPAKMFFKCSLCPEASSLQNGVNRYMYNVHKASKEVSEKFGGLLNKLPSDGHYACASSASHIAFPIGIESNMAMSNSIAESTADVLANYAAAVASSEADYEPAAKKKKLDLHRCLNCAKAFGSAQLLLKHEANCTRSSCKAVAETLLMLSEVRHPTATGRRMRRQQKPSRLQMNEIDGRISDCSDGISSASECSRELFIPAAPLRQFDFKSSLTARKTVKRTYALKGESTSVDSQEKSRRNRSSAEKAALVSGLDGIADFKALTCLPCSKHFTTKFNLLRHAKRHVPARQYKCTKCDFSKPDKATCLDHVRQCHVPDEGLALSQLEAFVIDSRNVATAQLCSSPRASTPPAVASHQADNIMTVDARDTFSAESTSTVEGISSDSGSQPTVVKDNITDIQMCRPLANTLSVGCQLALDSR